MKKIWFPLLIVAVACGDDPYFSPVGDETALSLAGKPTHFVSVGGADLCESIGEPTGCDGNFSLVAKESSDGSVSGQWSDAGLLGMHAEIDCVVVDGNQAIVGGVITKISDAGEDAGYFVGGRVVTFAEDNGRSKKDPQDRHGFTNRTTQTCAEIVVFLEDNALTIDDFLFEQARGQVIVR